MTDRISLSAKLAKLFSVIDHLKEAERANSERINQLEQDTSLSAKLDELFRVINHLKEAELHSSQRIRHLEEDYSSSIILIDEYLATLRSDQ